MAAFERKTLKFEHRGLNWNRPTDLIPAGQVPFAKNIRVPQQGEITSRPGLTAWATLSGRTEVHSISRLNNFNSEVIFDYAYVVGADDKLYVGKTPAAMADATLNPVDLPGGVALSGNPLSVVDMAAVGGVSGWKYLGDSTQMLAVGYYPGDLPNALVSPTMARALTMGMTPPVNTVIPASGGAGNLNGDYQWAFAYRRRFTGARSNPSVPTRVTLASPALTLTNEKATFTLPTTPIDPQTGSPDTNVYVEVYRFGGTIFRWVLVGFDNSGATFTDDFGDDQLQTAPSPPSITDPNTGLTRFNLYRPFPTQDIAHFGDGTLAAEANGVFTLTRTSGDFFNTQWLPGSYIGVNNGNFSIFQVRSSTVIELAEDATAAVPGTVPWAVPEGTIRAGQPMPHLWGPFGTGQTGAYLFGCGAADAPNVLFWTNGNDPDSTDVANSLVVTSPSEPLMGGCIYDGTNLLWSTERMFRVYPSLTIPGQFTVEEVPGGKGMYAPYSLAIQSTGLTDQHVSWEGKDGIYNWSLGAGLESLTDDALYPFFVHDNQPAQTLAQIFPWLTGEDVSSPDFTALNKHRITWFDGYMFFDFPMTVVGSLPAPLYATLVFDTKQTKGWVSLDLFANTQESGHWVNKKPISRGIEIAANNLKIGIGNVIYDYTGARDGSNDFFSRFVTRAEDMDDPRAPKLWGDYLLDLSPTSNTISASPYLDFGATYLPSVNITGTTRSQQVVDFASGLGRLSSTFGLDLSWTKSTGAAPVLYQWQPSFVPKPEITEARATDWTDDGEPGDKWVFGCLIEANTFNVSRQVEIHGDGDAVIATLTVNHNGQSTKPYSFTVPAITHQLRCVPLEPSSWELFRFIPQYTKKPELTLFHQDWTDDGKPVPKYLQGFVLEGDTQGLDVTVNLYADQALVQTFTVNHNGQLEKPYAVTTPPIIHEMRLIPSGNNIRYLDTFKLSWVYVQQPEFTHFTPDYTPSDPMAYHGVAIEADTQNVAISVDVVSEGSVVRTLTVQHNGRVQKAYSFLVPFYSTEMKLIPRGDWRQYPDWKVRWIAYPKPDLAALYTDWTDDGYQGAKFMQGFVLRADTAGQNTDLTIEYDGGQIGGVFTAVNHNGEMEIAYSFQVPFIAHLVRAYPSIPIRYTQPFNIRWIWEPAPELAKRWITQTTSHQLRGWFHHRDSYIALQSYDFVTFRITDDLGTTNTYVFASTGGAVRKLYEILIPQKAKLVSYALTSCLPFRLFQKDCEVRVGEWGRQGEYVITKPFGGPSYERGAYI